MGEGGSEEQGATKVCSECGLSVWKEATVCEHCGNIFKKAQKEERESVTRHR